MRNWIAIALSMMLSACVSTPEGSPALSGGQSRGRILSASDTVALFVSTGISPTNANSILPISDKESVHHGFMEGFRAVRPDVQILVADEALRKACFDTGISSLEPRGAELVAPDLSDPTCRAWVENRRIRYVVSATGSRSTTSSIESLGFGFRTEHSHVFRLLARTFDTTSGSCVCEDWAMASALSGEGVALIYGVVPIPAVTVLDEPAYWARVGWLAGARVGTCFVQPSEGTGAGGESSALPALGNGEFCLVTRRGEAYCIYESLEACRRNAAASSGHADCVPRR